MKMAPITKNKFVMKYLSSLKRQKVIGLLMNYYEPRNQRRYSLEKRYAVEEKMYNIVNNIKTTGVYETTSLDKELEKFMSFFQAKDGEKPPTFAIKIITRALVLEFLNERNMKPFINFHAFTAYFSLLGIVLYACIFEIIYFFTFDLLVLKFIFSFLFILFPLIVLIITLIEFIILWKNLRESSFL